jgi:UPF0176 protein
MVVPMPKYQVILFYKYVTIADPHELMGKVRALAEKYSLLGRALIAEEGINATFEGSTADTEAFVAEFLTDERFSDVLIKRSEGDGNAFPKLAVKVRTEIVGTNFPDEEANPRIRTAPRLTPEELHQMFRKQEDFVVVDMRNDYEYASGHFKGSIDPGLQASRDLPTVLPKLDPLKKKKVVTVCTGGVRCEKMSAYLMNNGFDDVYQLENGIHGYMEKFPGEDFVGTLYTFDKRKTMHFGGNRQVIGTCYLCNDSTENYVNCANDYCHLHFLACKNCTNESGAAYCSDSCAETQSHRLSENEAQAHI